MSIKVIIQIIKKPNTDKEMTCKDIDAPLINEIAEKFGGNVTGNYKGGNHKSIIEAEIELPEEIKEIRIKRITTPQEKKEQNKSSASIGDGLIKSFFNGMA